MEEIMKKFTAYIASKVLNQPKIIIHPDESFISSALIDSFSLVDLILFIENKFGICVDNSKLNTETLDTLQQHIRLTQGHQ